MFRFLLPVLLLTTVVWAADDPVVFKSDVAVTRVDAQVVDHDGRTVTGLQREDFVLRVDGKVLPIRNFASENMPIDILLLLDVSGSMQPHVQRIANAAQQALNVLAPKDRVAIMVFDTYTRVKLPFSSSHADVTNALGRLLRSEHFNGGTRITGAMLEAARYVDREARPDARRAIVILTDDQTQDQENESEVESALRRSNAVLSFLQAQYEEPMARGGGRPRGPWGSNGGGIGFPGGGGGIGFPGSGGGLGLPGGMGRGGRGGVDTSHTAGTADIAHDSGGDTMQVDDASSLEDTLTRLRQRYALYFYLPEGSTGRNVQVDLADRTRTQFQEAEVRYRRVYMAGSSSEQNSGPVVSRVQRSAPTSTADTSTPIEDESAPKGRRMAVNEDSGPQVNTVDIDANSTDQPPATTPPPSSSTPHLNKPSAPPQ